VTACPTAKLIFAANTRPRFLDRTTGIWRRMIVVPFDIQIPEVEQNKKLADELKTEMSGIFNWALIGLERLLKRGIFIEPKKSKEAREEYMLENNPTRMYLEEKLELKTKSDLEMPSIYEKYSDWMKSNNYFPLGSAQFSKEFYKLFKSVKTIRKRKTVGRVNVVIGIAWQK